MEKKTLFRFLLLIIIVILLLCIILLNIGNKKQNNIVENNVEAEKEIIIPLDENVIIPKNSYLFFGEYIKGEIESQEIYNTIYYFSNTIIPKYYTELKGKNEKEIIEYYEKNQKEIEGLMNVEKKEEFVEFIKYINSINVDTLNLEQIEFMKDTIMPKKDFTEATIKFVYKGDKSIKLNVKVFKKVQKLNRNIIFSIIE